jgi:hypothetical protein
MTSGPVCLRVSQWISRGSALLACLADFISKPRMAHGMLNAVRGKPLSTLIYFAYKASSFDCLEVRAGKTITKQAGKLLPSNWSFPRRCRQK